VHQHAVALVLYCTLLYCTVTHCTALHCTALHCTVLPVDKLVHRPQRAKNETKDY